MRAIRIQKTGGPEVLDSVDLDQPTAAAGQILVKHAAIGLNFIDTYQRVGLYPLDLPTVLGREASGVVEAVGSGVTGFKPGDRVAYVTGGGAYADYNALPADNAILLPDAIDFETGAACMLKGMTAEFLADRIWPLSPGDHVLVHAAAGGVGAILSQWLHHRGVKVIGTAGTKDKADFAKAHGCDHVILYRDADVAAGVRALTGGEGVKVAYDSVGKDTAEASLSSLAKRGLFVTFGNASGPVPPVAPLELSRRGSLFMTRPTLFDYIATPTAFRASAKALFEMIASGVVKIDIGQTFALADVRKAHEALESRATTGATVLVP
jgi:NADPH2:quinone reductase